MTNAELINVLRYCKEHEQCEYDASAECPYEHHWTDGEDCQNLLLADAADALEAAEKRIAELEEQHGNQLTRNIMLTARLPKEGEWFKYNNPNYSPFDYSGEYLYHCNKCGKVVIKATNYCPNCGARMKGANDEAD